MDAPIYLIKSALADLFAQVSFSGVLTLADRYGLMAAIFDDSLTLDERGSIDRLLRSVARGRLKIVNEISALR